MTSRREKAFWFADEPEYPTLQASVRHRVGFSEVDPMQIVWFGRYAVFFEQASAELRDQCGLANEDFFRKGIQPPIVRYDVEYIRPCRLDESLKIVARLHGTDAARMNMSYQVFGPDGELRVLGRTVQVFWDAVTHSTCMVAPAIWQDCLQRWKSGEFACLHV